MVYKLFQSIRTSPSVITGMAIVIATDAQLGSVEKNAWDPSREYLAPQVLITGSKKKVNES